MSPMLSNAMLQIQQVAATYKCEHYIERAAGKGIQLWCELRTSAMSSGDERRSLENTLPEAARDGHVLL